MSLLNKFLTDWLAWAEAGAPDDNEHNFDDEYGLCSNASTWARQTGNDEDTLDFALQDAFVTDGRCTAFPFGQREYLTTYSNNQSEQPERLAWVREHLA